VAGRVVAVRCGESQHGQVGARCASHDLAEQADAVARVDVQVQQQEVRLDPVEQAQRLAGVDDDVHVSHTRVAQHRLEQHDVVRGVVDNDGPGVTVHGVPPPSRCRITEKNHASAVALSDRAVRHQ
jgi:hypothetical protein